MGFIVEVKDMEMEKVLVERSIWIAAPREQVWQAVTNPERLVQWFVPNLPGAVMRRDDSGKLTIYMGEMGVDFAILEVAEPLRQATIRSLPDKLLAATYTLEEEIGGTRVTVAMTGFEALPEDAREDRLDQSGAGWQKALKNLKAAVDGAELTFPQAFVGPLFGFWREPGDKLAIERSIWIAAPREQVWAAITDPKQIQQWFSPTTPWELSALEVGGRYYVFDAEKGIETQVEVIERIDPPHQLVTRAMPEPPDTVVKDKIYTLKEEHGGTRLTLTLAGYEQEPDGTRWGHMEENAFGFGMMLQNTKAHAEGQDLPFPWGF
jgi:uncharacterized protein YndB with AHSA1/START domain